MELIDRISQDIQDDYYLQNFANDGERFLAWYLRNVHLRSPIQARDDITDGANDKQIDAVIVDDERRAISIIQGKFFSSCTVDHEPLHEILAAWLQIRNLSTLQENGNNRLKVKLAAIAEALEDDYVVEFELVTTGSLSQAARDDLAAFQDSIGEFENPEASVTLVDEPNLKARWDEAMERGATEAVARVHA